MTTTDAERVAALHQFPTFCSQQHIQDNVLPTIAVTTAVLTLFYFSILNGISFSKKRRRYETNRAVYQFTNLVTNAVLASAGVYFYRKLPANASPEDRVTGMESDGYVLACMQVGYQLWSLLLVYSGVVKEPTTMVCHHLAVLIVASKSCILTNGFRYHNPFFYGMVEASSVPLAIINYYKDRPSLQQRYPNLYVVVRILFMILFLSLRIIMLLPRKYDYLKLCYWLAASADLWIYKAFLGFCWCSAFFLACLQIFWAVLIVKGFMRLIAGLNKGKKKRE